MMFIEPAVFVSLGDDDVQVVLISSCHTWFFIFIIGSFGRRRMWFFADRSRPSFLCYNFGARPLSLLSPHVLS
jgi:hypothetical protein